MRSEEAVDAFSGFTSSDSEDSIESEAEPLKIPAGRADQHEAAKGKIKTSDSVRATATSVGSKAKTAADRSASVVSALVLAVDDPSIKRGSSASPSPLLKLSKHHSSPKSLVVALGFELITSSGDQCQPPNTKPRDRVDSITRKETGPDDQGRSK